MSAAVETTSIQRVEPSGSLARLDEMVPVERLLARVGQIRDARDKVMTEGVHYGKIPGVDKPTLLKPGAETLCMAFQLAPDFKIDERWDGDHLEVVVTCKLIHVPSGNYVGSGIGSCSTKESKYAYRKGVRLCPKCGKAAIIKGQEQFGGGWVCWKKKDGCGAKFNDGDKAVEGQSVDRVANEDVADQYNTVRKMGCKRAHVAATLFVTGASELFTQDVEDMGGGRDDDRSKGGVTPKPKAKPSSNADGKAPPTDEDFDIAVLDIRRAKTTDELQATGQKYRDRGWTPGHRKQLKEAIDARLAQLKDPDFRDDEESDGPPDDGEKAPW